MACFNDEKDLFGTEHDLWLSEHSRSFEVCEPTSTETLKKSKRSLEDAKAVLVINGQLDGPSGKEFEAMIGAEPACDEFSTAFASQPGLICKHILRARWESRDSKDRDVIGGCYFFESVADVETYLNSDFWLKCERETQWKEVVGEVRDHLLETHHISNVSANGLNVRPEAAEAFHFYATNNVYTGPIHDVYARLKRKLIER